MINKGSLRHWFVVLYIALSCGVASGSTIAVGKNSLVSTAVYDGVEVKSVWNLDPVLPYQKAMNAVSGDGTDATTAAMTVQYATIGPSHVFEVDASLITPTSSYSSGYLYGQVNFALTEAASYEITGSFNQTGTSNVQFYVQIWDTTEISQRVFENRVNGVKANLNWVLDPSADNSSKGKLRGVLEADRSYFLRYTINTWNPVTDTIATSNVRFMLTPVVAVPLPAAAWGGLALLSGVAIRLLRSRNQA